MFAQTPSDVDALRHLDILIFSGDVDASVPVTGTRQRLASLQMPVVEEWRTWHSRTSE